MSTAPNAMQGLPPQVRQQLTEMTRSRAKSIALHDDAWFVDAVGTSVCGASYLLGGAPGSRKSGLAAQLALDVARQNRRVLLVPTEEPLDRVYERLVRMMGNDSPDAINRSLTNLIIERNPPSVEMLPGYVSSQILSPSGAYHGAELVIWTRCRATVWSVPRREPTTAC